MSNDSGWYDESLLEEFEKMLGDWDDEGGSSSGASGAPAIAPGPIVNPHLNPKAKFKEGTRVYKLDDCKAYKIVDVIKSAHGWQYYVVGILNDNDSAYVDEHEIAYTLPSHKSENRIVRNGPMCDCGGQHLNTPHHYRWCSINSGSDSARR